MGPVSLFSKIKDRMLPIYDLRFKSSSGKLEFTSQHVKKGEFLQGSSPTEMHPSSFWEGQKCTMRQKLGLCRGRNWGEWWYFLFDWCQAGRLHRCFWLTEAHPKTAMTLRVPRCVQGRWDGERLDAGSILWHTRSRPSSLDTPSVCVSSTRPSAICVLKKMPSDQGDRAERQASAVAATTIRSFQAGKQEMNSTQCTLDLWKWTLSHVFLKVCSCASRRERERRNVCSQDQKYFFIVLTWKLKYAGIFFTFEGQQLKASRFCYFVFMCVDSLVESCLSVLSQCGHMSIEWESLGKRFREWGKWWL